MRKLLLSLGCLFFLAGAVLAAEATLVKYDKDKKEVTVKEGDKEKTYKLTDKTKYFTTDKDGKDTEAKFEDIEKRISSDKAAGKAKLNITTDGDNITELKMSAGKKK